MPYRTLLCRFRWKRSEKMASGQRRTLAAHVGAALGFVCGFLGVVGWLAGHAWKLGVTGWFTGGALLVLLALFALVDGTLAAQKVR